MTDLEKQLNETESQYRKDCEQLGLLIGQILDTHETRVKLLSEEIKRLKETKNVSNIL